MALLDSWDPRVSRGKQGILASLGPRVTVENQVPLVAAAGQVRRVSLVPWDPRDDQDPQVILGHRDLQASQVHLGSPLWARKETGEPLEKGAWRASQASLAHPDTLALRVNLVQTVQLAKRDLLESRGSMDLRAPRVIQDLQDRRDKQGRREDLACQGGPARAVPWDLSGRQVLQEKGGTLGPQGLQATLDCLVCQALWETW